MTSPSIIGIVVKDVEDKIRKYCDFGIIHWKIQDFDIKGDLDFKAKMAFCRLGNIIIKLIEPKSESIFLDHLNTWGESIHHIKMEVDDYEETLKYLNLNRVEIIFSGKYQEDTLFYYFNTIKHINFVIEISNKKISPDPKSGFPIHP